MNEVLDKVVVGGSCGEVPVPSHSQGLIEGLFEPVMGLLDISILMRFNHSAVM